MKQNEDGKTNFPLTSLLLLYIGISTFIHKNRNTKNKKKPIPGNPAISQKKQQEKNVTAVTITCNKKSKRKRKHYKLIKIDNGSTKKKRIV